VEHASEPTIKVVLRLRPLDGHEVHQLGGARLVCVVIDGGRSRHGRGGTARVAERGARVEARLRVLAPCTAVSQGRHSLVASNEAEDNSLASNT
jgi:hypothetical protein